MSCVKYIYRYLLHNLCNNYVMITEAKNKNLTSIVLVAESRFSSIFFSLNTFEEETVWKGLLFKVINFWTRKLDG